MEPEHPTGLTDDLALSRATFLREPMTWVIAGLAVAVFAQATAGPGLPTQLGVAFMLAGVCLIAAGQLDRLVVVMLAGAASVATGIAITNGVALLLWLSVFLAVALVLGGLWLTVWELRGTNRWVRLILAFMAGGTGLLLGVLNVQILTLGLTLIGSVVVGVLSVGFFRALQDPDEAHRVGPTRTVKAAATWLAERPADADDPALVRTKLLYEGQERRRRTIRFIVLMVFASAIASFGVLTDSTAVVIGAMLIAPLLTPLMGMSLTLVNAWLKPLGGAALVAGLGVVIAITVGFAVSAFGGQSLDVTTNSQITSRVSPTMLDLAIAVFAGSAGAYALSRHDVADSLPGVAVAIALVPPLTVIGITLQQGAYADAAGASLLFATNALAILVMGAVTFILTGSAVIADPTSGRREVRSWLLGLAAVGVVVFGGLSVNGFLSSTQSMVEDRAIEVTLDWLEDQEGYELADVELADREVVVILTGPEAPDDVDGLVQDVMEATEDRFEVDVRLNVQQHLLTEE